MRRARSPTAASTTSLAPFLFALNTSERKWLDKFQETCQFCVVDVKHNVDQRTMHPGLMFFPEVDVWSIGLNGGTRLREPAECEALPRRWFTPSELYTAMGLPITEAATVSCCGNTMHLHSGGAVKVLLYLVLPCLGGCPELCQEQS